MNITSGYIDHLINVNSSPRLHGIVVAKEFEDILLEAWETEQQLMIEKEMDVRMLSICK